MKRKIFCLSIVLLSILLLIPITYSDCTDCEDEILIIYQPTGAIWEAIWGVDWSGQSFYNTTATGYDYYVTVLRLLFRRQGNPAGNIVVSIRAGTDPTGPDLASDTIVANTIAVSPADANYNFTMNVCLENNANYTIVVRCPDGDGTNFIEWKYNSGGNIFVQGTKMISGDSGASWTWNPNDDHCFQVFGNWTCYWSPGCPTGYSECFEGDTADGWIATTNETYIDCFEEPSGTAFSGLGTFLIGQSFSVVNDHQINRAFLFFNTSSIPDNATIYRAYISLYHGGGWADTDFFITVQRGNATYPHNPLQADDYYYEHYTSNLGQRTTAGWTTNRRNITLTEAGREWISLTGMTNFTLRSNREIDMIQPFADEDFQVNSADNADITTIPILCVEYYIIEPYITCWHLNTTLFIFGMVFMTAPILITSKMRRGKAIGILWTIILFFVGVSMLYALPILC